MHSSYIFYNEKNKTSMRELSERRLSLMEVFLRWAKKKFRNASDKKMVIPSFTIGAYRVLQFV